MFKRLLASAILLSLLLCGCSSENTSATESSAGSETQSSQTKENTSAENSSESDADDALNDDESLSEKSVEEIISGMSIEEKIGQMLMLSIRSWEGKPVDSTIPSSLAKLIRENNVGNIILFAENFTSIENTVYLTSSLQNALDSDIPMFIGVDQEGGNVVRLSYGCSLTGNMALGAIGSTDDAYTSGKITGEQLGALGVNLNLAPALDVNNNPKNPVINVRSFSEDPNLCSKLGSAMIKGMQDAKISSCAKHFPGHGDTVVDSHYGLPCIDKTLEEIKNLELIPFQGAIDSGVDMIMTAHLQFPKIEQKSVNGLLLPATLSKTFLTDLLKGEMGFEGVIITDSMQMDAIGQHFSPEESSILAIEAGVDILLMPVLLGGYQDEDSLKSLISAIKDAIDSQRLSMERIDDAVTRILTVKKRRGFWKDAPQTLQEQIIEAKSIVGNEEHKKIERSLASKSITILENKDENLFSDLKNGKILFCVPSSSIADNVSFAVERLVYENSINISFNIRNYKTEAISVDNYDGVVILTDTTASWKTKDALSVYNKALENGKKTAVISCRLPYDAVLFTEADCLLICYCPKGESPAFSTSSFGVNIPGAIEVLFGASNGQGKLPVTLYDSTSKGDISLDTIIYPIGFGK